jgi:hypothetical protein
MRSKKGIHDIGRPPQKVSVSLTRDEARRIAANIAKLRGSGRLGLCQLAYHCILA